MNFEESEPTIRWAIIKRLDKELGVRVIEVLIDKIEDAPPTYISVGVHVFVDDSLQARSRFHLPETFDHPHLLNEIDEMCEHFKAARADFWGKGRVAPAELELKGNGLRGNWPERGANAHH